jgi:hypothetical protein
MSSNNNKPQSQTATNNDDFSDYQIDGLDNLDIAGLLKFQSQNNSLTINNSGLQVYKKQKTNGKKNDKYLNPTVNVSTVVQQNIDQNLKIKTDLIKSIQSKAKLILINTPHSSIYNIYEEKYQARENFQSIEEKEFPKCIDNTFTKWKRSFIEPKIYFKIIKSLTIDEKSFDSIFNLKNNSIVKIIQEKVSDENNFHFDEFYHFDAYKILTITNGIETHKYFKLVYRLNDLQSAISIYFLGNTCLSFGIWYIILIEYFNRLLNSSIVTKDILEFNLDKEISLLSTFLKRSIHIYGENDSIKEFGNFIGPKPICLYKNDKNEVMAILDKLKIS